MSGKVADRDHGARDLLARVRAMHGSRTVRVGILSDAPKREDAKERGKHSKKKRIRDKVARRAGAAAARKLSLLEIAIVHEFGGGHVPARSFIRATVDAKRAEILKLQVALAQQVLLGKITPDQALSQLGAKVAGWMKTRIAEGIAPPLSEATIKRKGSSVPLINTGQLRSSITHVVEGAR